MPERDEGRAERATPRWHWRDSQEDLQACYPREQPARPEIGAGWFDEAHQCFFVWDGREWVCLPGD